MLTAGEARRSALGRRPRPLARVLAAHEDALGEELHGEEGVLVDVAAEIDQALGEPDRERGVLRDLLREPRGSGHVLTWRHHLVDETDRERLRGPDHAAG